MTRKRLFLYHVAGFAGMCATFVYIKSSAAPAAVAFALTYLAVLLVTSLVGWLLDVRSRSARFAAMAMMVLLNMVLLTGQLGPEAGIAAVALSLVTYWPRDFQRTAPKVSATAAVPAGNAPSPARA